MFIMPTKRAQKKTGMSWNRTLLNFDEGELTVSTPYYVAFAEYYLNKQQLEWAERHIERAVEALTLLKDEVSLANLQPLIEKIRNS
ncbi:MAG UNVERIFIED_CONTAM: hypothetical protein LVT10_15175 [Anaerolineae bacterium]|jgi:hypothetical protein